MNRALLLTIVAVALGAGCASSSKAKKKQSAARPKVERVDPEQIEGGRRSAKSRRASDSRPRPWVDEHRPFDGDRFGIEAYRVHQQSRVKEKKKKEEERKKKGEEKKR